MSLFMGAPGMLCSLGNDPEKVYNAICSGESGVSLHENIYGLNFPAMLAKIPDTSLTTEGVLTRFERMMCAAIDASLEGISTNRLFSHHTRVILCTTKGNIDQLEAGNKGKAMLPELSAFLQRRYELHNKPYILSLACISSLAGIIQGARWIAEQKCEQVLLVAADISSAFTLAGFQSFMALSPELCQPYDENRMGINLGEASAALWISADKTLFKNVPLARYSSGSVSNDANHVSGPSRTGEGLYRSIENCLKASGGDRDMAFILAHGTATKFNDDMESEAFFRSGISDKPILSLKPYLGHTLGTAGLIESILGFYMMNSGRIPGNKGFKTPGTSKKLNINAEPLSGNFHSMLKTVSGFGGVNATVLFRRIED